MKAGLEGMSSRAASTEGKVVEPSSGYTADKRVNALDDVIGTSAVRVGIIGAIAATYSSGFGSSIDRPRPPSAITVPTLIN